MFHLKMGLLILFCFILCNIRGQSESAFCGQKLRLPDVLRLTFFWRSVRLQLKKQTNIICIFFLTVQSDKHSPWVTVAMKLRWAGPIHWTFYGAKLFLCAALFICVNVCVYIYIYCIQWIFQISRINVCFFVCVFIGLTTGENIKQQEMLILI